MRRQAIATLFPLVFLALAHGSAPAAPDSEKGSSGDDKSAIAAALVRQLGADSYQAREEASQRLLALGRTAKPALLDGLKIADPEIRNRCERLLVTVLEADFKARLQAF